MEPHCRVCHETESGPRGLQDILVSPCQCRGTVEHIHLSCLHNWQLHKALALRDAARCEVCGQPYRVPADAWRAYAAAGGAAEAAQLRLVDAWQRARPALVAAAGGALRLARAAWRGWTVYCWLGQCCAVCIEGVAVPQLPAGLALRLPPTHQRLRAFAALSGMVLAQHLLLERAVLGGWHAVRQRPTWRAAKRAACACGAAAAAAALQRARHVSWDAPGAPAKQPPAAALTDGLAQASLWVAAARVMRVTAEARVTLGPLAPGWLVDLAPCGYSLLALALATGAAEAKQEQLVRCVEALLGQRPAATRALHATLAGAAPE